MKPDPVSGMDPSQPPAARTSPQSADDSQSFDSVLEKATLQYSPQQSGSRSSPQFMEMPALPALSAPGSLSSSPRSGATVSAAYRNNAQPSPATAPVSSFQKYKDDQLLRNPGGRGYYLDKKEVVEPSNKESVLGLVRKDSSDVLGNIKNFIGNMLTGTTILYRNDKNEIQEGHQKGLLRTVEDFFKDMGSALSLGALHPKGEAAPRGFKNRLFYSASKLKDALMGDILKGVPSSANHMAQNLVLSGWHLAQILPDAVTGSFAPGQKLTTTIFDNGHVAIEYLTDVIPSGDAWLRVHASSLKELKPPILYNLKMPEHFTGDTRWEYVRNTPFRKTIETIGALLSDALTIELTGQTMGSSNRRNQVEY